MTVDALRIVAEPRRREILRLVWDRELAAGEIAGHFEVTFGAVSQHLGILRRAGFLRCRSDGRRRFYRANRPALGSLQATLEAMWATSLDQLVAAAEDRRS